MSRFARLALALMLGAIVIACGSGANREPRELVAAAADSTAQLKTVRASISAEYQSGGETYGLTFDADIDLVARDLEGRITLTPDLFGTTNIDFVIVDQNVFARSNGEPYIQSGMPGADPLEFVPTTAAIATAIDHAIQDPATVITRVGSEACGDDTCERLHAAVPPAVVWRTFIEILRSAGDTNTPAEPVPESLNSFELDFWVDPRSDQLRQLTVATSFTGQTLSIVVVLSRHDEPLDIKAPIEVSG